IRVAISRDGDIYISDLVNHRVRRLGNDGVISTFAGTGIAGFSGDLGPATNAQLNGPIGLAVGPDGTLYIADTGNNRVRQVTADGNIITLAGDGEAAYLGDTGTALTASLNGPTGVTTGPDSRVYVADTSNSRVRQLEAAPPSLSQGALLIPSEDG